MKKLFTVALSGPFLIKKNGIRRTGDKNRKSLIGPNGNTFEAGPTSANRTDKYIIIK
ncbi:MAG: hypothetical protein ABJG69_06905 [Balneola sp.]